VGYYGTVDIEKTIEFILHQQARSEARWDAFLDKWEERENKWEARHVKAEKQIAAIRVILKTGMKLIVKLEEGQKRADKRMDELAAAHRELAASHKELAVAQAATAKSLKAFIDSMRRGGNGRH